MKITAIDTILLRTPYECGGPKPNFGGRVWDRAETLLVKVQTDAGVTGWGEAFGYSVAPATKTAIDTILAPLYIGCDARNMDALMRDMQQRLNYLGRNGSVIYGMSGIDIALWDIAGKVANQPLHRLFGGAGRSHVTAYSSLMRYTDPAIVAKNTAASVQRGFNYVKLHEIDEPQVRAAREAGGPHFGLMVDTNCPWSLGEALRMARLLSPYNLYWLEEPCWPPENFEALAAVRAKTGVTIAAGENAGSVMDFKHMFQAGAVDVAQPSVTKIGGITEMRKVMALADAFNVRVVPHSPYFGPGLLASLQLLGAWPQESLIEWLYFDLEQTLYGDAIAPRNGQIAVPQGPGLGLDPDSKVIERYRVA
jgi:D-galactarolactone cycloisomerase